jgi:hypothetical protein
LDGSAVDELDLIIVGIVDIHGAAGEDRVFAATGLVVDA